MKAFGAFVAALGLAGLVQSHMEMTYPAPFKSKYNPFAGSDIDYSMTSPLSGDGSNFPCKGYQSLLGTAAGAPTATWQAGQQYNVSIAGGADHGGGSCQASLSFDKSKTWTVIKSYIGNCPIAPSSSFKFTLPVDTPAGVALFAWTWFNKIGNREMYMNCAAITVKAGSGTPSTPLSKRPAMFVANVGNGCGTTEGVDLMLPNPGPDVDLTSSNTGPPVGQCASGPGAQSSITSVAGVSTTKQPSSTTTRTTTSTTTTTMTTTKTMTSTASIAKTTKTTTSSTTKSPIKTTTQPGGVFITVSASTIKTTLKSTTRTTTAQPVSTAPATGIIPPGTPCSPEGYWSCDTEGKAFQRCASGTWSVSMSVAPGTKCRPGQSMEFVIEFA
ncbi:hypothetical protein AK830_g9038 [Neonectria ditissima]|uniref:Spore coat protein SP96 n=1 Tax=Neonectria ditissima TaxID=78410 RepID=A0A0P7B6H0_9HYPO|nr:hypothetical protein AK830_g9038 [Neonectria ditissima]